MFVVLFYNVNIFPIITISHQNGREGGRGAVRMFRASSILMGVTKRVIKSGSGPTVQKGQNLTVHCTGKLSDGKKFWRYVEAR